MKVFKLITKAKDLTKNVKLAMKVKRPRLKYIRVEK